MGRSRLSRRLIIGRPILQAKNIIDALKKTNEEISINYKK